MVGWQGRTRVGAPTMAWIAPLPWKTPEPDDYLELGQDEDPRVWIPAGLGMLLVLVLLIIATLQGKI
jgi:hypothetical protein